MAGNRFCTFGVHHVAMTDKTTENLAFLLAASRNPPWFNDGRKHRCAYCGEATDGAVAATHPRRATRDHILAKAQGGAVTVPACRACNQR